jgi:hypothetical protein
MTGKATSAGGGRRLGLVRRDGAAPLGPRLFPASSPPRPRGAVLLEVVLATALFFMGALVVMGGLNIALRSIQRVQFQAEAADLAVTLLSEVQMRQVPLVDDGPKPYEEDGLTDWTWQIATLPVQQPLGLDLPAAKQVEIIIRKKGTDFAYRLTELVDEEPPPAAVQDGATVADGQGGTPADGGQAAPDGTASSGTPNYSAGGQTGGGAGAGSGMTSPGRGTGAGSAMPSPGRGGGRAGSGAAGGGRAGSGAAGAGRAGNTGGGPGGGRTSGPRAAPRPPPAPAPEGSQ